MGSVILDGGLVSFKLRISRTTALGMRPSPCVRFTLPASMAKKSCTKRILQPAPRTSRAGRLLTNEMTASISKLSTCEDLALASCEDLFTECPF